MRTFRPVRPFASALLRAGCAAVGLAAAISLSCGETPRFASGSSSQAAASPTGPVNEELLVRFKADAVAWVRSEREAYRPRALPLSDEERSRLGGYFPREVLDRARVATVKGFENPEFFSVFATYGEPIPVDLRRASGLALVDTILMARAVGGASSRDRLLFHELVHLVQYQVLGLEAYIEGYVESWAENGRSYRSIPHESQAFELASRFSSGAEPFSVEREVRARFVARSDL